MNVTVIAAAIAASERRRRRLAAAGIRPGSLVTPAATATSFPDPPVTSSVDVARTTARLAAAAALILAVLAVLLGLSVSETPEPAPELDDGRASVGTAYVPCPEVGPCP